MMLLPIDHLGIAGRDIRALVNIYEKLGFQVTRPQALNAVNEAQGVHDLGQQSAHIMFADSYLELTAVSGALDGHHLEKYLQAFSGAHILALATDDAASTQTKCSSQEFSGLGFKTSHLQHAQRQVSYGNRQTAEFNWFQMDLMSLPGVLLCGVEQVTPEVVFQGQRIDHPNRVTGYAGMHVFSTQFQAAQQLLTSLSGFGSSGKEVSLTVSDCLHVPGDKPLSDGYLAEITFSVASMDRLVQQLDQQQIPYSDLNGNLMISNQIANGAGLIFSAI